MLATLNRAVIRSKYDMGYYSPHQEQRTAQLTVRLPKGTKEGLEALARLWTHIERVRTGDPEVEITVTDVANRLLRVGLDGAWAEIGAQPRTEAEWTEVLKKAEKVFAPENNRKK
jgi:hypothetical protein